MRRRSSTDLGPPLVEMLFKAASIAVLTWLVAAPAVVIAVFPIVSICDVELGPYDGWCIGILCLLLAALITLCVVLWSVVQDVIARRRGRARAAGRAR